MDGDDSRYGCQYMTLMEIIPYMDYSRGYEWRSKQIWISVEDIDKVIADMDFSKGNGWRS